MSRSSLKHAPQAIIVHHSYQTLSKFVWKILSPRTGLSFDLAPRIHHLLGRLRAKLGSQGDETSLIIISITLLLYFKPNGAV